MGTVNLPTPGQRIEELTVENEKLAAALVVKEAALKYSLRLQEFAKTIQTGAQDREFPKIEMTICAEADGRSWQHCTRGIQGCICGFNNPHRVAHVLRMHNKFRRGEIEMDHAPSADVVGLAIDAAIEMLTSNAGNERTAD